MAKSDTNSDSSSHIVSRRDLSEDQIADIEFMLTNQNMKPSEICREMDIPIRVIQNLARDLKYRSSSSELATLPSTGGSPATMALNQQIAAMEARQEKMRLDQQYNLMLQRERLELNQIRIDQRRQMLEIEADYPSEDPSPSPQPDPEPGNQEDPLDEYNFDEDPIGAGMKFIDRLSARANASKPSANIPMIDATKPLTNEMIDSQIALTPPESLKAIRVAIGSPDEHRVIEFLKKQYPGITEENVQMVLKRLKDTEPQNIKTA